MGVLIQRLLAFLAVCSLVLLTACQRISEDELRLAIGRWLELGQTVSLEIRSDCLAFQARTVSGAIKMPLQMVNNLEEARIRLLNKETIAVLMPGWTATEVSQALATAEFALGLSLINSARAAQPCMGAPFQMAFVNALNKQSSVLIFDPIAPALTIFDRPGQMVFHVRGAAW